MSARCRLLHWRLMQSAVVIGATGIAAVSAAPPLDDGAQGMTCHYYAAAARLAWQRQGGDWEDADGSPFGDRPYATAAVGQGKAVQILEWDITELARRWAAGRQPSGAVFLRAQGGGIVNVRSREHAEAASHPVLEIEWDDGRRERVGAITDTYFSCTTQGSLGRGTIFKVGGGEAALLVFPFPVPGQRRVRSATLLLTGDKVYGAGLSIGVYQPLLPPRDSTPVVRGLAQSYRNDVGIEGNPDVFFADRFEGSGRSSDAWSGEGMTAASTVAADAANRFESFDGKALAVTIAQGKTTGLNSHYRFAGGGRTEPETAFFRYYLRLGDNWDPIRDGGKLPGFSGTYGRGGWGMRKSDGRNGWSARGSFFQHSNASSAANDWRGIGSYVYHADMQDPSGTSWGWGLGPSGLLQKNRWYSVEQQVKLNQPGASDGELRAWIDGQLVMEKTGLRFRDVPDLKIESVWMNVYHGGTAPAPADLTLYIDNVVIARRYIGPVGSAR